MPTTIYPRYTPVQTSANKIGTPGFVSAYKVDQSPIRQTLPDLGGTTPPLSTPPRVPSALDTAQTEYYNQLDRTVPTADEESTVRENIRKNMQSTIDAINLKYQNIYAQQAQDAQGRFGSVRALNARGGLVGSPTGETALEETRQKNLAVKTATEAEQALEIAAVTEKIDGRAREEIRAKKQEALGNAKAYIDYLANQQTSTREDIKNLAKGGIDLSKLPAEKYKQLLDQSGLDEFTFQGLYNDSKPDDKKIKYEYEVKDGKAVAYGVDPVTGEFKVQYKDIPGSVAANGKYSHSFDQSGRLILIPENLDPSKPNNGIVIMGNEAGFKKTYAPDSQKKEGWEGASTDQKAKALAWINAQAEHSDSDVNNLKTDPSFFLFALGQAELGY